MNLPRGRSNGRSPLWPTFSGGASCATSGSATSHPRRSPKDAASARSCVQNHYNLAHRVDDAVIDELARDGIAYVPYFPLGGFTPLQSSALSDVARRLGATPMQVALAWLLRRARNILLIPGTSSVAHLRENVAAADLDLPDDAFKELLAGPS